MRLTTLFCLLALSAYSGDSDSKWEEDLLAGGRLMRAGDLAAAEAPFERALELAERFDKDDPRLALTLNNFGALYLRSKQYDRAKPLLHRAARLYETIHGAEHETTANAWKTLGVLHLRTGNPGKAKKILKQSLSAYETTLGPDDPKLVEVLTALARCERDLGYSIEVESHARWALRIRKEQDPERDLIHEPTFRLAASTYASEFQIITNKAGGDAARRRLVLLERLGGLHADYGDPEEGERLMSVALQARERVMGKKSPSLANCLVQLAESLRRQERLTEAREALHRALRIIQADEDIEPTATVWILQEMADLAEEQGSLNEAARLEKQILEIEENAYGGGHPFFQAALKKAAERIDRMKAPSQSNEFAQRLAVSSPREDIIQMSEMGENEEVQPPTPIKRVSPVYSQVAWQRSYEATVTLSADISPHGRPGNIHVRRCAGHGLDKNAVRALERWRFKPGMRNGKPVTASITMQTNFIRKKN